MNNKKKIMLFIGCVIVLVLVVTLSVFFIMKGNNNSPEGMTNAFMKKYQKLDDSVVEKIEYEFDDKLTPTQLDKYKEIIKEQYERLEYTIVEVVEKEGENSAEIIVEFTVEDLASAMEMANSYIEVNGDKFEDDYAAIDYKLSVLDEKAEEQTYTITFEFYKEDGKWTMYELHESDLKKLRGTY